MTINSIVILLLVASEVLSRNYILVKRSHIGLTYLADKLLEIGVINDEKRRMIVGDKMIGDSEENRLEQLLYELKEAIAWDGKIFSWFIKTLNEYDTVSSKNVAEALMELYNSK